MREQVHDLPRVYEVSLKRSWVVKGRGGRTIEYLGSFDIFLKATSL